MHYKRWRRMGDPAGAGRQPQIGECSVDGCARPAHSRGFCTSHYQRWQRGRDLAAPRKLNAGRACQVNDCDEPVAQRDYCKLHYGRWRRHGDPSVRLKFPGDVKPRCSVNGCEEQAIARGLCKVHYWSALKAIRPECSIDGCDIPAASRGWCPRHYQRWKKYGDPLAGPAFRRKRGTGLPKWAYDQRRDEQKQACDQDMLDWAEILRRDPCSYCHQPCEHIDHIVPFAVGGELTPENTTAACALCNVRKNTAPLLLFLLS